MKYLQEFVKMAEMMYNECMRKPFFVFLALVVPVTVVIVSCSDFFSTSWAPWAARDPSKLIPAVTTANVDDLIAMAESDPDLSLAVLKKIQEAAKSASGDDKLKLQAAALEAAANSVGIGQSVLGAAGQLTNLNGDHPDEMAKDMVIGAINGLQNLEDTCSALLDTLPPAPSDPLNPDGDFLAFANKANADDLAMAAVILIAGEAKNQMNGGMEPGDYVDELGEKILHGDDLTGSENLAQAMALASVLAGREDEISGPLKSALEGLNLLIGKSSSP